MENPKNAQTYVLVAPEKLESLVKTNFMLSKSVLLFEYLCSQSRYPMYLSARAACEVLGISSETLISCRHQRLIPGNRKSLMRTNATDRTDILASCSVHPIMTFIKLILL